MNNNEVTTISCNFQMDFLEHQAVTDVIIMSVVLDEVKHRNQSIYQRLRTLCASDTKRFFVFANENHRYIVSLLLAQMSFVYCPLAHGFECCLSAHGLCTVCQCKP